MSTSLSEALGETPEAETPVAESVEPETPEVPEPESEEAKPESVEEPKPEPQMVPVGVVQGLRQEIRDLKAAIPQKPPEPAPDVFDDPQGYQAHMEKTVQNAVFQATLQMSRAAAVRSHGQDAVDAAAAAIDPNSAEYQAIITSPDPFHALMEHTARQQAMEEIGDDPAAFKARIEAEVRAKVEAEMAAKQVKSLPPSPSLAASPNVGARSGPVWAGPTPLDQILGD